MQFSLLSRAPIEGYGGARRGEPPLLDACAELGVTLVGYSPLSLGLLSGRFTADDALALGGARGHAPPGAREAARAKLPDGPRGLLFARALPSAAPLLGALEDVARARGRTVAQVAINWVLCHGDAVALVGARDAAMVRDNLGATGWRLTDAEREGLQRVARGCKEAQATQNAFQVE